MLSATPHVSPSSFVPFDPAAPRRRASRHAVDVSCLTMCAMWNEAVPLRALELSSTGAWVRTDLPLETGTQLVMEILPPGEDTPVHAVGVVNRADDFRRDGDPPAGMAIDFVAIDDRDRARLERALQARPPALPRGVQRKVLYVDESWVEDALDLDEADLERALARLVSGDLLTSDEPLASELQAHQPID